jgi:TRAP-type C4-dicarboxylate transport system permease small subunit
MKTFIQKLISFIAGIFSSESPTSSKRILAFMFSISLILAYFYSTDLGLKRLIIYCFCGLIALLLGLATVENIVSIFKGTNNSTNTVVNDNDVKQ